MSNKTILLVEDNPDDEALTLRAFKKNNILNQVTVARDGQEALDYFFDEGAPARARSERAAAGPEAAPAQPWAAADGIVDNGYAPNYVFRLSLRDSWAMPTMLRHAAKKGTIRRAAGLCLKRAPLTQRLRLLGVRVASLSRIENKALFKQNDPLAGEFKHLSAINFESSNLLLF